MPMPFPLDPGLVPSPMGSDSVSGRSEKTSKSMRSEDPRVLVVTNMWPSKAAPYRGIFVKEQVDAVRRHQGLSIDVHLVHGKQGYLRAFAEVPKAARAGGYDVVHAHYGLTGAVSVFVGAPLVVTYHGSDVNLRWQRTLSRFAARRADYRIVVSADMARLLGAPGTQVIPCGVDTDAFRFQGRDEERGELGLAEAISPCSFPATPGTPPRTIPCSPKPWPPSPPASVKR